MKSIIKYIALMLSGALVFFSCESKMATIEASHTPAINGNTLTPIANESGSVRAYIGTEVTAGGFNLDLVGRVTMADIEAEITEQVIDQLKFKIPALELAQQDAPHPVELLVYGADASTVIYRLPYYVSIPVTDALVTGYAPVEGTVGTEVTLTGRNLMQITRVHFGEVKVEATDFVEQGAETLKFAVPAGTYTAGNTEHTIEAEWGTQTIDVTLESRFMLHVPRFDAPTQSTVSVIGDEIAFTGENLDLVSAVKWGDDELTITAQSAEAMSVKFPSSIAKGTPIVQSKAITALYGTPQQSLPVVSVWNLDTTPTSIPPVVASMTAADGYYIGKSVTLTGEELLVVEGVELRYNDGTERNIVATITEGTTNAQLEFTIPDGVTFTTATEVDVRLIYNTTDNVSAGTAKIYPFYAYKGLRIATGSNSKNTYGADNQQNAFLLLDSGKVISVNEWMDESIDPFAKAGTPIVNAGGTVIAGTPASDYYSASPYLFFSASSANKLGLNSPANSASQLKTHYLGTSSADYTPLPSVFGSPVFYFRVMADADDAALKASIVDGSVESVSDGYTRFGGSAAPALGAAETSSVWVKGSVIVLQYINAAACTGQQGKPDAATDIYKQGYMYIKDITNADLTTGLANADRAGYIEFDLYWSKTMTE